eukprot:2408318-Pyramimonas_sp.AAC.1
MCAARSSVVSELPGGLSQLLKYCARWFHGAGEGKPDLRHGITIQLGGETVLVHGSIGMLTQDERAHKHSLHAKGATGVKICAMCKNVLKPDSKLLPDRANNYLVPGTCVDVAKFDFHDNDSLLGVQQLLKQCADETPGALDNLQIDLGFVYEPEGLLQDFSLGISLADAFCWDWMHCYMIDGTFVRETTALLQNLEPHGFGPEQFFEYCQSWQWPKSYGHARDICKSGDEPSGTASEFVSMAPVLDSFLAQ